MNTIIKKMILPALMAGTMSTMYSCGNKAENKAEHKVGNVRIEGLVLVGVIKNNNSYVFWDNDEKPGYDAITGYNSYSNTYFCKKKLSKDDYGIVISDSTQKYMSRLQEDLQKIEEFTKKDYENAKKNN